MRDCRGDRAMRASRAGLIAAWCAAGLVLGVGSAAAATAASQLGPVSPRVLAVVNSGGTQYLPAHRARPRVRRNAALRHALSNPPWPGCATGISLMRTTSHNRPSGRVVWLVSVHPDKRVLPVGGGPRPGHGHSQSSRHAANFFVVAVSAKTGREVQAQDGYSRKLPPWRAAQPSPCEHR